MKYTITSPETEQCLATVDAVDGVYEIALADTPKPVKLEGVRVRIHNGQLEVVLGGQRQVFPVLHQASTGVLVVATSLGNLRLLPSRGAALEGAGGARAGAKAVKSSMPGKVLRILCKAGEMVEAGQPLLIIEAMKMENEIRSPQAGLVEEIGVNAGQSVQTGDLLVKIGTEKK